MGKLIILGIIIIIGGLFWYQNKKATVIEIDLPPAQEYQEFVATTTEEIIKEEIIEPESEPKLTNVNLDIPFTSQAPTANWNQPFQDACEEAGFLMVDYYYQNKELPGPMIVEDILENMVNWQIDNWGDHHNLLMAELAVYIEENFSYQTEVIEDLTAEKIREYLDQGQPMIVPADGHKLINPFFSGDGPEYHMLVIKGYRDNYFITNDPGTRRGADFVYTEENLFDSIFEWNQKESQATGPQTGLIIIPD